MSTLMEDDIKPWTAKRKTAQVPGIIQGKTTVSEASRAYDLTPSEAEQWVNEGKRGMENALHSKPLEIKEQYARQLSVLQQAYGEAMLELRVPDKSWPPCWATRTRNDPQPSTGIDLGKRDREPSQAVPVVPDSTAHGVLPQHQIGAQGSGALGWTHQGHD